MLDRDTKGHLALGLALVDCLAVAGMTLPQAQAFSSWRWMRAAASRSTPSAQAHLIQI